MKAIRVVFGAILACGLAQPAFAQQAGGGLAGLYQRIIAGFANGKPPSMVEVTDYLDKVPGMSQDEIRSGLPWIEKAFLSPTVEVRHYGGLGLFMIDQRQDSRSLIEYLVSELVKGLSNPQINTRIWAVRDLLEMKPRPPEEAIRAVVGDLNSGKDSELAAGIVFELVQIDPNRADIAQAVETYLRTPNLTAKDRIDTLNALATRPVEDPQLIDAIVGQVNRGPENAQIAAIAALRRSGQAAVARAKPALLAIERSERASDRLKSEAKAALNLTAKP